MDARRGLYRGLWTIGGITAALALALLAWAQTDIGAHNLSDLWSHAHLPLLGAAFASMTMAFFFMALRWRALMPPGYRPPALGLMAIVCAGLLLNYALPGPMGELGAAWFASRRYRVPWASSLASGVAARMVGLAMAALTAAAVWAVADLPVLPQYHRLVGTAVVVIGVAGVLLAALTARPGPYKRLATRLLDPLVRRPDAWGARARRLHQALDRTADGLSEVTHARPGAWLRAMGWSAASHGSVILGIYLAASSFEAHASLAGLVFSYVTTTAGAVALFALPGSQLGWDAMFLTLLVHSAGLTLAQATAVALTVRVHHLLVMGLGAAALSWLLQRPEVAPPEAAAT